VTEDACDNEGTKNFGEESEKRDVMGNINPESSYDEVNISDEEAGFEDTSEDAFDDEDTGENEIKNISEEEAGFKDASEDAFTDEDTGEDEDDDDINPEGKYDDEKKVEVQLYEKPEKRDGMVNINIED
jgi:hypothetical protein